jgi:hypothetical protein
VLNFSTEDIQYISLSIAIAALIQPWIIALLRKLFAGVTYRPRDQVDISFNINIGNTIGFSCFVLVKRSDLLIEKITAKAVRKNDGRNFHFDALFHRKIKLVESRNSSASTEAEAEEFHPVWLRAGESRQMNVLLVEKGNRETVYQLRDDLLSEIQDLPELDQSKRVRLSKEVTEADDLLEIIGASNEAEGVINSFYDQLVWTPGDYEVTINVKTNRRDFSHKYAFNLDGEKNDELCDNVDRAVRVLVLSIDEPFASYGVGKVIS